ncbi:MAG: AAA family ATPase [Roseiflexaceae bacterium]
MKEWYFPGCPAPPDWWIDWEDLLARYDWLGPLAETPQEPQHHAEGDVLTHTRMVAEALCGLEEWRGLEPDERSVLFASALLHDIAKPVCTVIDGAGRISSPNHARKGEPVARTLLWRDAPDYGDPPRTAREQVARLVRHHGLPLWFLDREQPERALVLASQSVRLDRVALLAEADARGRICADQRELLARIDLFRQLATELECYDRPRAFASDHSRFAYCRNPQASLSYDAYDDTRFEVVLMCGLPASGKDTWTRTQQPGWPVISLDAIREELEIEPTEHPGPVAQAAKRRARELLQHGQPFVWNATNITRLLRRQLIDFFSAYGARVRIVCTDAPLATILRRNRARTDPVPERVILRMLEKFEAPDLTEAHSVEYVEANA